MKVIKNKTTKGCIIIILIPIIISAIISTCSKSEVKPVIQNKKQDSIELALHNQLIKKQAENKEIENQKFLKTKAGKIYKKHPEWSKDDCVMISKNKIWIGMNYDMLIYQRGKPDHVNTSNYGNGNEYQCCWDNYDISCFYMKEDRIITSWN